MSKRLKPSLTPDRAVLIATEDDSPKHSQWYTDGKYTFRFVRVAQFLYSLSASHLRNQLKKTKPVPPTVEKSGRTMVNKADPFYKESLALWQEELRDLAFESKISTALFVGLEVHGDIPPEDEWLPGVLSDFAALGISEEEAYRTFYHDKARLHELWFKKYVLLDRNGVMDKFSDFHADGRGQEAEDDVVEVEDVEGFASDLFQLNQE